MRVEVRLVFPASYKKGALEKSGFVREYQVFQNVEVEHTPAFFAPKPNLSPFLPLQFQNRDALVYSDGYLHDAQQARRSSAGVLSKKLIGKFSRHGDELFRRTRFSRVGFDFFGNFGCRCWREMHGVG